MCLQTVFVGTIFILDFRRVVTNLVSSSYALRSLSEIISVLYMTQDPLLLVMRSGERHTIAIAVWKDLFKE